MTVLASELIDQAWLILNDTGITYTAAEMLAWLNRGQHEIVILRPSAYVKTTSVLLAVGTKQTLPADGLIFFELTRNMGVSPGTTPGLPLRQINKFLLDTQVPGWHTDTPPGTDLEHWVHDLRIPKTFWVYPPANGLQYVELQYAALPPGVANVGDPITLDDVYATPLVDYMVYRASMKDVAQPGNEARAAAHRQAFERVILAKAALEEAATGQANSPRSDQ